MPTYDRTANQGNQAGAVGTGSIYVMKQRIDLNVCGAALAQPAAADVLKIFNLPQSGIILAYGLKVVKIPTGTGTPVLTLTFGSVPSTLPTIAGTAVLYSAGTANGAGIIYPATLTNPDITQLLGLAPTAGFEWLESEVGVQGSTQPYLNVTFTTITTPTDLGVVDFYAAVIDLTGAMPRDPNSVRALTNLGQIAGYPMQ